MGKLWYGGSIYPMTDYDETFEAIFTNNGKIVEAGKKYDLEEKYRNDINERISFKGALFPGFIDSHLHIIGHGEKLLRLDLSKFKSKREVINKVNEVVKQLKDDEWLIGEGFNENNWDEPFFIHRNELDEVADRNPVVLTRVCRHALIANTKAMDLAQVNNQTQDVSGGVIERDDSGVLTGAFHDQAQELIRNYMPNPDLAFLEKAIDTSVKDLLSYGVVSGHSEDLSYYGSFKRTFQAFKNVIPDRRLFRAHLLVHHAVVDDLHQEGYNPKESNDWLEFGAMKLFVDGALGGRTAWLSSPYEDDPTTTGVAIHSHEELEELVKKARNYGMSVAAHAIGDQAVEEIVKLFEKYPPPANLKDRIIHAQVMRRDLIKQLKGLQLMIDIQPTFVASDFPWVIERLGEKRAQESYPWKSYLEEDILCAGGSDAPIEMVNPILGIRFKI